MKRWWNLATLATRSPPKVGQTPADVVFRENKWRLLRYRPRPEGTAFSTPILLVPSLINRHYVLDLMPGKSFAEYLVGQGHPVFVIDWGTPGDEDRHLTFDDITDRYLGRALRFAARSSPRGQAHLLGYCLGGTLAAIHAAVYPEPVASLTALAAPIDFGSEGMLASWTRARSFDVDALVDGSGNVPWQLLQLSFQMLRPTLPLSKAVHLIDRAWNDEFLDGFLALETWGNDNVSFPGEFYRRYLGALYRKNELVEGSFSLSGKPARLSQVSCPTLAVTFEHDTIVPAASAAALLARISSQDKHQIHLPGGHVGAVVSKSAAKTLWPQLSAWWAARDLPATPGADRGAGKGARATAPNPRARPAQARGQSRRARSPKSSR